MSIARLPAATPRMSLRSLRPGPSVPPSPLVSTRAEVQTNAPLQQLPNPQVLFTPVAAGFRSLRQDVVGTASSSTLASGTKQAHAAKIEVEQESQDKPVTWHAEAAVTFNSICTFDTGPLACSTRQHQRGIGEPPQDHRMTTGPTMRSPMDFSQAMLTARQGQSCHEGIEAAAAMACARQALQEVAELKHMLQKKDEELAQATQGRTPAFDAACYLSSHEIREQLREHIYQKKPPSVRATLNLQNPSRMSCLGPKRRSPSPGLPDAHTPVDKSKLSL